MRGGLIVTILGTLLAWGCADRADDDVGDDDTTGIPGDDDTTGIPGDDDVGDDDSGADDDTATPDDDSAADVVTEPELVEGSVTLSISRSYSAGSPSDNSSFIAHFMEITELGESGIEFEDYPENPDECGLMLYDYDDLAEGTASEYVSLAAGTITVLGPDLNVGVDAVAPDWLYHHDFEDTAGLQFSALYHVQASGDQVPAFDEVLVMPEELVVTSPDPNQDVLLAGDIEVTWDGGDDDVLYIGISVTGEDIMELEYGTIACLVSNDGEFTIPGTLVDLLPRGFGGLYVTESTTHYLELNGHWAAFNASFSTSLGARVP